MLLFICPPPRHRRALLSFLSVCRSMSLSRPRPSTRVKAPRTRWPRLDPEDVVVEGRVGAELRLLEAEGLAPGRLLRSFLWCWLCLLRRWRVSLSPRRCACVGSAVGSLVGSAAGLAIGSEVGSAAAAAVCVPRPGGTTSHAVAPDRSVGVYAIAATRRNYVGRRSKTWIDGRK